MSVPETFDSNELLEHNVKFFGGEQNKIDWNKEVKLLSENHIHQVVFIRPDRGEMSVRKRMNANRTYGTKKRASKSKKVLKVTTVTESDGVTDIVMGDADDVIVPDHDLSRSFSEEFVDDVIGGVVDKSENSVVNKSTSIVDDDIIVVDDVVPDKSSDKELSSTANLSVKDSYYVKHLLDEQEVKFVKELNAKDARIAELEKLLEAVKASSKKAIAAEKSASDVRVDNIGRVAREGIDAMVGAYVGLQPTALSEVMEQLQRAATVSLVKRGEEIRGGNVYISTIAKLDEAMSTKPDA